MRRLIVFFAVLLSGVVFGAEAVDSGELAFRDEARDKTMYLRVRYPDRADGACPLVVFSHGMGGSYDAFPDLSTLLAEHGYVVVHPMHSDSIALRRRNGESGKSLLGALSRRGMKKVDLPDRIADCVWVLDHLDEIEHAIGRPGLIDRKHAAMAGHSAGAMTTQALAGLRFYTWGGRRSRALVDEPRFDAFVVISGQGTTRRSLKPGSWEDMKRPMLVFTGSEDVIAISNETPASRREPFEHAPPGGKYLVFIDGATHSSYSGSKHARLLREQPPENVDAIVSLVDAVTLHFLDAYIRGDAAARAWMDSDAPASLPGVKVEYQRK